MKYDQQGLPVSGAGDTEILAVDTFRRELLAMNGHNDGIVEAARAAPDCGILQTYAALFFLYGGTIAATKEAQRWLQRAAKTADTATERETLLLAAARSWAEFDYERAAQTTESITEAHPRDVVAAKICEFQYYVLGQHHSGERFLAHAERIAPANEGDADVMAMHSFALELTGHYAQARTWGEKAVELRATTPWAHHSLSHLALVTGDYERGISEQSRFRPTWDNPGPSIHGHDAWHLAVLHLAAGNSEAAWKLFRELVWGHLPGSTGEQTDATALLWRLEMAGVEVPRDLWNEIAAAGAPLCDEALFPFVTIHQIYALARAQLDAEVDRLRKAARDSAQNQVADRQRVWNDVGLSTMEGAIAYARDDMNGAVEALQGVAREFPRLGGSDAQDDLFRLALLTALRRAERSDEADAVLKLFPGSRTQI